MEKKSATILSSIFSSHVQQKIIIGIFKTVLIELISIADFESKIFLILSSRVLQKVAIYIQYDVILISWLTDSDPIICYTETKNPIYSNLI